ncbi:MAG: alpha/beta hydrolase [Deltaproteobacteria bacterium]|nr:alpha/beta hydrolase [Deltaproteobacteria bacterium]
MPTLTAAAAADCFRAAPDRFLDVGAGEVAYRRVGSGPDVLFVHGWPVSGATFRTLLPYLVDHVTCHVIDLPGSGASRFDSATALTVAQHIHSVRRVVDLLGFADVAVVGHDSGGMIARHAVAGDARVRAMGLINTEIAGHIGWRFRSFLAIRHLPGVGPALGWVMGRPGLRRNRFVLGDAFLDARRLDGEFDEFFLRPLHRSPQHREAAVRVLRSFDYRFVRGLADVHRRISVPVQLVWGEADPFFPLAQAERMVGTFPDARLAVIAQAGLFAHEERPAEVAQALLPTLLGRR